MKIKCRQCNFEILKEKSDNNYAICPNCGCYMNFQAEKRISSIADNDSFCEWDNNLTFDKPMNNAAYSKKIFEVSTKCGLNEAIITGTIRIDGIPIAIGVMDTRFMMASMGFVVGEKVTRLFEKAKKKKLPVLLFCCSGGARMQEGIISLMQMEKTASAIKQYSKKGLLYISVLTDPTMGGVTASFATLADIIIAEKDATIGFAGPRVIEQNTGVKLPKNFQTANFQFEHGFVDSVVSREEMKTYISKIIRLHCNKGFKKRRKAYTQTKVQNKLKNELGAWEIVKKARDINRPTSLDYINGIFKDFVELHGDRVFGDDHAVVGGIAKLYGMTVTVIGQQKGKKSIKDSIYRNWGMPSPSGFRKALRLMKYAEKFKHPIILFVDTIGAACGIDAEEQGQGFVIADILKEASAIKVPILSIIHGEGGSGGALAFSVANEIWILENAVYSILTPEGYASILWKDNSKAAKAAEEMKMTSEDLYKMKIVDKIYYEPNDLTLHTMDLLCRQLKEDIAEFISKYSVKSSKYITKNRHQRFRKF